MEKSNKTNSSKKAIKSKTVTIKLNLNGEKEKTLIEIMRQANNKQGFLKRAIRLAAFVDEVNRIRMSRAIKQ